jgi:hypothetical protein
LTRDALAGDTGGQCQPSLPVAWDPIALAANVLWNPPSRRGVSHPVAGDPDSSLPVFGDPPFLRRVSHPVTGDPDPAFNVLRDPPLGHPNPPCPVARDPVHAFPVAGDPLGAIRGPYLCPMSWDPAIRSPVSWDPFRPRRWWRAPSSPRSEQRCRRASQQ